MPPWWIESHDRNVNSYHNITEAALCEYWKRAAGLSNEWFDQSLYDKNYDRSQNRLTGRWRTLIGKPDAPAPTIDSMESGASALRSPDIDMLYSPAAYRDCRKLALTMVKQSAFWWFDFFGGYYNSPEYERELTFENEIFRRLSKGSRESASEAAKSFVEKLQ